MDYDDNDDKQYGVYRVFFTWCRSNWRNLNEMFVYFKNNPTEITIGIEIVIITLSQ